jgi:hypothetical protein
VEQPAVALLHSAPGCFGTLVLLHATRQQQQQQQQTSTTGKGETGSEITTEGEGAAVWPNSWGRWQMNVVHVQPQQQDLAAGAAKASDMAVDAWGLLLAAVGGVSGVGVLVRPDGIVAAVGGPAVVRAWLAKHVVMEDDAAAAVCA